jgi:Competence protein A.
MKMNNKENIKKLISLQIFSNEIRAVQVSGASGKVKISAYGSARLPEGTISGGLIAKPEVFMKYLRDLLSKYNFNGREIVLSISNQGLIIRLASFPKVSEDKQRNVCMLQAQNFIPIPINELELSYFVTDENIRDADGKPLEEPTISALLVAAKRDMLNNIVDTIQDPKYGAYIVKDIVPTITTVASEIQSDAQYKTYMVMNANNDVANILIINNGKIAMARSIQFDQELAETLNKSDRIEPDKLNEIIEIFKNEFWSSVNYYRMSNSDEVEALYISAQTVDISRARHDISTDLNVDVEIFTMEKRVRAESDFPVEKYSACICAATEL